MSFYDKEQGLLTFSQTCFFIYLLNVAMLQEIFCQIHKGTRNTLLLQREIKQKEGKQKNPTL